MAQFIIEGGQHLKGEIEVRGMKNATTPILAATLLTKQPCLLKNVPNISDVRAVLDIIKNLGGRVENIDEHTVKVSNQDINPQQLEEKAVRRIRSSVLFMGPLLARFGKVDLPEPGGCIIGNRPLDTHTYALEQLGAKIEKKDRFYGMRAECLKGAVIILPEFSVTATENVLMAASLAEGRTVIKLAAAEPHVQDLCNFLNKMGAKITGIGTNTLTIDGVKELNGAEHTIIPDQIEAGTFAVMAAATRGEIKIKNIIPEHLEIILLKLKQIGVNFKVGPDYIQVLPSADLKAFKLQTMPYPGFPTDLQSPFGVLATQCQGTSLIQDPLFEGNGLC